MCCEPAGAGLYVLAPGVRHRWRGRELLGRVGHLVRDTAHVPAGVHRVRHVPGADGREPRPRGGQCHGAWLELARSSRGAVLTGQLVPQGGKLVDSAGGDYRGAILFFASIALACCVCSLLMYAVDVATGGALSKATAGAVVIVVPIAVETTTVEDVASGSAPSPNQQL